MKRHVFFNYEPLYSKDAAGKNIMIKGGKRPPGVHDSTRLRRSRSARVPRVARQWHDSATLHSSAIATFSLPIITVLSTYMYM